MINMITVTKFYQLFHKHLHTVEATNYLTRQDALSL